MASGFPQQLPYTIGSVAKNGEGLQFRDVCVELGERCILQSVSGCALPGRVLAVMGPSASGKTTLLNTISGYSKISSGTITLNGQKRSGAVWHRVSYVMQNDVFFSNLTLKETLTYSALLRLPRELSFKEKLTRVTKVIDQLQLSDCANTNIGSFLTRGLSGGEKKRTSIACELLTDPVMLLLDEPTTGLDSSNALTVMKILCNLAADEKRIVVLSIHQPSSQIFQLFNDLLLIAKGKVAYFGEASQAISYFANVGLHCTMQYNPADYMLEKVMEDESRRLLIGTDPVEHKIFASGQTSWWLKLCCYFKRDFSAAKPERASGKMVEFNRDKYNETDESTPLLVSSDPINKETSIVVSSSECSGAPSHDPPIRKWPTRWYWQFLVLVIRSFRLSRRNIISTLGLVQAVLLAVICGLIWFQVPYKEESIFDRYSYLFFVVAYWSIDPVTTAALSLPMDKEVVTKELTSHSYYLSAYYMAKLVSELIPVLLYPSIFLIITFWAAGIGGPVAFFGVWAVLIVTSFVSQSLGVMLGSILMDIQSAMVAAQVSTLGCILVGGFYVRHFPSWLFWIPQASFVTYSFDAMLQFTFTDNMHFSCPRSAYEYCNTTDTAMYIPCNVTGPTIPGTAVLDKLDVTVPLYMNFVALIAFAIGFRILGYLILRILGRYNLK